MAVSISMMFGRLGSAIGANFVAFMLDNYCDVAFYVSGTSLIGNIQTVKSIVECMKLFVTITITDLLQWLVWWHILFQTSTKKQLNLKKLNVDHGQAYCQRHQSDKLRWILWCGRKEQYKSELHNIETTFEQRNKLIFILGIGQPKRRLT